MVKIIYRNANALYHPNPDGTFQRETLASVNAAKRESRQLQKGTLVKVKRGTPPKAPRS